MKKTLSVIALGLLAAACIPHDPNEIEPDVTPWGTPRTHTSVSQSVVAQPAYTTPQQKTIIVQQTPQGQYIAQPQPVVLQQAPQVRYVQAQPQRVVVQQAPQVQYVQPTQPVVIEQPKQSWWQRNKAKHAAKPAVPPCPCKDPNDPCTHCYQK